ncbi:MAG: hypothetical protein WAT09_13615 [Paracoccaceae bacterium]
MQAYINANLAFTISLGLTGPIAALDTVTCHDAESSVTFTYVTDSTTVQPIVTVEVQLHNDSGLSTDPAPPNHASEYVSNAFIGDDMEGAGLSWKDGDEREQRAMRFRIGRVYEAGQAIVGGVVSTAGGGRWAVTCRSSDLDMQAIQRLTFPPDR